MKKILVIFGTRPEAIKIIPVILELKKLKKYKIVVVVTAQHRKMLDRVLTVFDIKPNYDLDIMESNQSLFKITNKALEGLEHVLEKVHPDIVLIQGDTTTTLSAALAAFYRKIPIGYIESGLRSFNKFEPYPEEINRIMVSHMADYHFAPTELSKKNLLNEGLNPKSIYVTGNTAVDALLYIKGQLGSGCVSVRLQKKVEKYQDMKIMLVTAHRRENWGDQLDRICNALIKIIASSSDAVVFFAVHLNPNVREVVKNKLGKISRIVILEPLDYISFVYLMEQSYFIVSDSGGIQEEAPSLGKPVLIMRNVTERPEGLKANVTKIVGTDTDRIVREALKLLNSRSAYEKMTKNSNPFGDGIASVRIAGILDRHLSEQL